MLDLENAPELYLERSRLSLAQASKFDWRLSARSVLGLYHSLLRPSDQPLHGIFG
jgi:hypothetical protein